LKSPARVVVAAAAVVGVSADKAYVLKSPAKVVVAAGAAAVVVVSVEKAWVLKSPARVASERSERERSASN
jgi:hypothetical protein